MKQTIDSRKWVLLPIEVKNREMHSRILLANELVNRGYGVILGKLHQIRTKNFPGIIIFNSFGGGDYENLLRHEKKIIVMDEESIVRSKDWIKERINPDKLKLIDFYVSPGDSLTEKLRESLGPVGAKVLTLGNPRIDLLDSKFNYLYDTQVKNIRKKYKRFILINTAFPYGNFLMDEKYIVQKYLERTNQHTVLLDKRNVKEILDVISYYRIKKEKFLEGLRHLTVNFPEIQFILRPHPGENPKYWRNELRDYKNIKVVKKGNVISWLKACDLLIQSGCTTALEAFVLNKPCVSMDLTKNEVIDPPLPKKLSLVIESMSELKDFIEKFLLNEDSYFEKINYKNQLQAFKENLEYNNGESFMKICDKIDGVDIKASQFVFKKRARSQILSYLKAFLFSLFSKQARYEFTKFSFLSNQEIKRFTELINNQKKDKNKVNIIRSDFNQYIIFKDNL
jgi:surface carbohydrate biosynthesis protein